MNAVRWLLLALFALFCVASTILIFRWTSKPKERETHKVPNEWSTIRQAQIAGAILALLLLILPPIIMTILDQIARAIHMDLSWVFGIGLLMTSFYTRAAGVLGSDSGTIAGGFGVLFFLAVAGFLGRTMVGWAIEIRRRRQKHES